MLQGLKDKVRKALATDIERDAENLHDMEHRLNCCEIEEADTGERVELAGRIRCTIYHPEDPPRFEAELYDGSAGVMLVWLGRQRIPGIETGRLMKVEGRLCGGGTRRIYNPRYELLSEEQLV